MRTKEELYIINLANNMLGRLGIDRAWTYQQDPKIFCVKANILEKRSLRDEVGSMSAETLGNLVALAVGRHLFTITGKRRLAPRNGGMAFEKLDPNRARRIFMIFIEERVHLALQRRPPQAIIGQLRIFL